jgi:hypothetical protein
MVLQIMGSDSAAAGPQELSALPHGDATDTTTGDAGIDALQNSQPDLPLQQVRLSPPTTDSTPVSADYERSQHAEVENTQGAKLTESSAPQQEVRRHGTAKPRV